MVNKNNDLDDLVFLSENKVEQILNDLETHILYGVDFNYTKDMEQIRSIVFELQKIIRSYKKDEDVKKCIND